MTYAFTTDSALLIKEAAEWVQNKFPANFKPEIALMLGSGLASATKFVKTIDSFPYKDIPGCVIPHVSGHRGEMILAEYGRKKLLILSGRLHFYEGYSMGQITFPIRCIAQLGIKTMILTSAVGGIHPQLQAGDLFVIKDHLNFMGTNPLRGIHDASFGERFPDMTSCYTPHLQKLAIRLARQQKQRCRSGIYMAVSGPSYETPAEIRAFKKWGADVIGMSVVPEAIVAHQMGLQVLGLSYIANRAAGISKKPLSHAEVLERGKSSEKKMGLWLQEIIQRATY